MSDKNLYFIPIIAQALESDDPRRAMAEAFQKIRSIGEQPDYEEGFRQFKEFIKSALKVSAEDSEGEIPWLREAVYRLIHSLATDAFEGDEGQQDSFIRALINISEWNAEYERIKEEGEDFVAPEIPIELEVLKKERIMGSVPISSVPGFISHISPGSYTIRFSNGRVLWEGEIRKEDLIWAFAYPEKDLPMAAETEAVRREPTRSISLLDGELMIRIFAGLEAGVLRFEHGKTI